MRTTDPDPKPFKPLGEKVIKPFSPPAPAPTTKPQGSYGVVTDADGRMKTTKHPD